MVGPADAAARPAKRAESLSWTASTRSPRPAPAAPRDLGLYRVCGEADQGLVTVATAAVRRRVAGSLPHGDGGGRTVAAAAGVPQPWVRVWSLAGNHTDDDVVERLRAFVARVPAAGVARCGVAHGELASGEPVVAVALVDALADLEPLDRKTFVGHWLALEAELHVPADDAKVVLLGPRGRPKRVLGSVSGGRVRSRFALDQPGAWQIQVVASLAGGPTPVIEARVFVSAEPPDELESDSAAADGPQDANALAKLLARVRRDEGSQKLAREAALDTIAAAHAAAMARAGRAAHDAGDGSPDERLEAAGVGFHHVGENVARAPTVRRLHEALWQSPSHRENMLDPSFRRVGLAIARGEDGTLYGVELFAD
jgi:uncharacterized protein YkwD